MCSLCMKRDLRLYNLAPLLGLALDLVSMYWAPKKFYTPRIVPGFLGDIKLHI